MSDEPPSKHRILILAFNHLMRDARVLRQARALAPHFHVTLAGFGANPFANEPELGITWQEVTMPGWHPPCRRPGWLLWLGKFSRKMLLKYYMLTPFRRHAWHIAHSNLFRVIYCNDVDTLPIGVEVWRDYGRYTKVILDLHEYATREMEGGEEWEKVRKPFVTALLRHFSRQAHATITVADSFVPLYRKEFGMKKPVVVYNAPNLRPLGPRLADGKVHLVHHGSCPATRKLELMIRMMAHLDERFVLHLMLIGGTPEYLKLLRQEAAKLPAGKVIFEEPVAPGEIVTTIAKYDIGVYILPPITFNDEHAMPNKFFDFIAAGLAVAVAPSVNMAKIVREHGLGWVADNFTPGSLAKVIAQVSEQELREKQQAALKAREIFNGEAEAKKLVALVQKVAGNVKS